MNKAFGTLVAALALALASCESPLWENYADLAFPGLDAEKGVMGGQLGSLKFGDVKVGEAATLTVPMKNVGKKAIEISGITFDSKQFDFYGRVPPVFPMRLEPGEETDLFNVSFFPDDNGARAGRAIVEVNGRAVSLALSGTGYWELRLRINNTDGSIVAPVAVTVPAEAGEKVFKCVSDEIRLVATVQILRKLQDWYVHPTPDVNPIFENKKSAETTITVKAHTIIEAIFQNPYVFYPSGYPTLQLAINDCNTASKEAVIIENGTHTIADSVTMKDGVSLIGGYNAARTARLYITAADRADASYRSVLSFAPGAQLIIPGGSSSNTVVEGVTLTHSAAGSAPLLSVGEASKAVVRYATLRASGDEAAVLSVNSNFTLRDSLVEGGAGSKESVALELRGGGKEIDGVKIRPLVYRNVIKAGTANAQNSETFGVRADFSCYPTVVGNDIRGGSSTGSGGVSYGVHYINNGRGYFSQNTVDAGYGKARAVCFLTGYGTNLYLYNNNLSADEASLGYGVYFSMHGRVRRCEANGFELIDVLEYKLFEDQVIDDVDDLNDEYFIEVKGLVTNVIGTRGISIPETPELVP